MAQNTTPPTGSPIPLSEGEVLSLTIESMGAAGVGVARHEGFTVLVARGLPGERVQARIDRVHARHGMAHVQAVQTASPARTEPVCPHFADCGGCDWQHLDYAAQLAGKAEVLGDQLRRIGHLTPPGTLTVHPAPAPYGYRDRVEFSLVETPEGLQPAFHGLDVGGSGRAPLLPISECHLIPAELMALAQAAAAALAGYRGGRELPASRIAVQQVLTEDGAPGLALLLQLTAGKAGRAVIDRPAPLVDALGAAYPGLVQIAATIRPTERQRMDLVVLAGEDMLSKAVGERRFAVAPDGFFQVHPAMAQVLADKVLGAVQALCPAGDAASAAPLLLDLYCGVGLFALPLAAAGYRVVGMERDRHAVRMGRENARLWGVDGCKFHRADLGQPGELTRIMGDYGQPGLVIVDPPRQGLGKSVVDELLALGPRHILYVSCDGGTFARDAARLATGYALTALEGLDMFPQTHHLEILGTFTASPPE